MFLIVTKWYFFLTSACTYAQDLCMNLWTGVAQAHPGLTIVNGANASGGCRGGGSTSNIEWMAERMTGSKSGQSENGWGCDLWVCSPNCVMIELNWIQLRWAELNPTESSWIEPSWAELNPTELSRTEPNWVEPNRTQLNRTEPNPTKSNWAKPNWIELSWNLVELEILNTNLFLLLELQNKWVGKENILPK